MPQVRNNTLQRYQKGELQRSIGYALIIDEKAVDDGGGFTLGAWRVRDLNTIVTDTIGVTLLANTVTIPRGVYEVSASAPAYAVAQHITRLQNTTTAATVLGGTAEYSINSQTRSFLVGRIFIAADTEDIQVQHQSIATQAVNGLGVSSGITTNIYTILELRKVA